MSACNKFQRKPLPLPVAATRSNREYRACWRYAFLSSSRARVMASQFLDCQGVGCSFDPGSIRWRKARRIGAARRATGEVVPRVSTRFFDAPDSAVVVNATAWGSPRSVANAAAVNFAFAARRFDAASARLRSVLGMRAPINFRARQEQGLSVVRLFRVAPFFLGRPRFEAGNQAGRKDQQQVR